MTQAFKPKPEAKTIGEEGRLELRFPAEMAGQHVLITEERPGYWTIRTADVIPHDGNWLLAPENQEKLSEALEWAATTPVRPNTPEELEALFERALEGK